MRFRLLSLLTFVGALSVLFAAARMYVRWSALREVLDVVNQPVGTDYASEGSAHYVILEFPDIDKTLLACEHRLDADVLARGLIDLSHSKYPRVRWRVAYTLGEMRRFSNGPRNDIEQALRRMSKDPDETVREFAVRSRGELKRRERPNVVSWSSDFRSTRNGIDGLLATNSIDGATVPRTAR